MYWLTCVPFTHLRRVQFPDQELFLQFYFLCLSFITFTLQRTIEPPQEEMYQSLAMALVKCAELPVETGVIVAKPMTPYLDPKHVRCGTAEASVIVDMCLRAYGLAYTPVFAACRIVAK